MARGRRWGCWLVQGVEEALISQESTTKPQLFTFKRRGDGLFLRRRHTPPPFAFFIYLFFPEQCHVLPGPAGSQRPSSALTFGTSETRSKGGRGRGKGRGSRRVSGRASARVKFQPGGLVGVAGRRERNAVGKGQNKQTSKQRERASEPMHQKSGQSQESQADRPSSTTTMTNL